MTKPNAVFIPDSCGNQWAILLSEVIAVHGGDYRTTLQMSSGVSIEVDQPRDAIVKEWREAVGNAPLLDAASKPTPDQTKPDYGFSRDVVSVEDVVDLGMRGKDGQPITVTYNPDPPYSAAAEHHPDWDPGPKRAKFTTGELMANEIVTGAADGYGSDFFLIQHPDQSNHRGQTARTMQGEPSADYIDLYRKYFAAAIDTALSARDREWQQAIQDPAIDAPGPVDPNVSVRRFINRTTANYTFPGIERATGVPEALSVSDRARDKVWCDALNLPPNIAWNPQSAAEHIGAEMLRAGERERLAELSACISAISKTIPYTIDIAPVMDALRGRMSNNPPK